MQPGPIQSDAEKKVRLLCQIHSAVCEARRASKLGGPAHIEIDMPSRIGFNCWEFPTWEEALEELIDPESEIFSTEAVDWTIELSKM